MKDLGGRVVVVTRPTAQGRAMCRLLEEYNARPIAFPTVEIVVMPNNRNLQRAFEEWGSFDWVVFTSANAVDVVFDEARRGDINLPIQFARPTFAAIGPATAQALERRGATVQTVPDDYVAEGLVRAMGPVDGKRILFPRANKARPVLAETLRMQGALVTDIVVYDTQAPSLTPPTATLLTGPVHAVTFTSSSSVEGLLHVMGDDAKPFLDGTCVACIGPVTADTAMRHGIRVDVVADQFTTAGLVEALVRHFGS